MYKIIVVDDEDHVRETIANTVDWRAEGYQLVGQAKNGREALELYGELLPDVVLTDINMPYIDGLELLKILGAKFPRPKVILLTAYDEFENAQKAVKLNAVEYVLKPITHAELREILASLKKTMDKETAEREDISRLRSEFERSLPVLRSRLLQSLFTAPPQTESYKKQLNTYQLGQLIDKHIMVGLLSPDVSHMQMENQSEEFLQEENAELLQFSVGNIAEEILKEYDAGFVHMQPGCMVLVGLCQDDSCESRLLGIFEQIRYSIKKYLGLSVTIGVGYMVHSAAELHHSYESAQLACNYKMILGEDQLIYIADQEPMQPGSVPAEEYMAEELSLLIRTGKKEAACDLLDNTLSLMAPEELGERQIFVMELLVAILKTARALGMDDPTHMQPCDILQLLSLADLDQVNMQLRRLVGRVVAYAESSRRDHSYRIVAEATQYIEQNYANCDITVDKVCAELHVSASHFHALFKRETGDTFNNYLNNYRMQQAKELLLSTDLKMTEIAGRVGYADPNYFSYSFKKICDVTPRQYRMSGRVV